MPRARVAAIGRAGISRARPLARNLLRFDGMRPFSKILVPTDFSEHATEALRIAADLSRRYAAPIRIVYVYEPVSYPIPDGHVAFMPARVEDAFAELEQRLARARDLALSAGAVSSDTRVLEGFSADEIVDHARDEGFDLIVMGTHGRRGLAHVVLGSVAERVLRSACCPVLTVRLPSAP